MTDSQQKELTPRLTCLLTSGRALLKMLAELEAGRTTVRSVMWSQAYAAFRKDMVDMHAYLFEAGEEERLVTSEGRAAEMARLFPDQIGLPDRKAGR